MNKEQFEKLRGNLINHHVIGVGNACTASPIYLVRVKKIDWGYEEEFSQHHCIYFDESEWTSVKDFWECHELDDEEELEYFLSSVSNNNAKNFFKECASSWNLSKLWDWLEHWLPNHEYQYLHGNERWETINWFLTREEAENFVKGKGGDPEINIWVESLYRSGEFRGLMDAICEGKLEWKDEM